MRHLLRVSACVLIAVAVWAMPQSAGAADLDRSRLKTGMTLPEVVEAFGQPIQIEWINMKGTPVLFLFYEAEDCLLCLGPWDPDVLTQNDGRTVLPLGFVTERLANWGGKFYQQVKFPTQ
jgi:hypothetical protein